MGLRRVVDASPLILLGKAGHLQLLWVGADEVVAPAEVMAEVCAQGADDPTVQSILSLTSLRVVSTPAVAGGLTWNLGAGETAVLTLGLSEAEAEVEVVLDDLPARRRAAALSLKVRGTIGIVLLARRVGAIPAARPVIEHLRRFGMYLTDELVEEILGRVGE